MITFFSLKIKNNISNLYRNKIVKDSSWSVLGSVLGYGFSLLAGIIIARYMGSQSYGQYGMIKNTLLYVSIVSTFGLGITSTKFIAENIISKLIKLEDIYLSTVLLTSFISFIFGSILFFFSYDISIILDAPSLSNPLKITAFILFFNSLNSAQVGLMSGFSLFKEIAISRFVYGVVLLLFSVPLFWYFDFNGAIFGLLLSYVFSCFVNHLFLNKKVKLFFLNYREATFKNTLSYLLKFSFPITIQEGIYAFTRWFSLFILVKYSNYEQLGLYSAAVQWAVVILFIPNMLRNVTLSHLSKTYNNPSRHKKILLLMLAIGGVATLVPSIIVVISAKYIVAFYGVTFSSMVLVLQVVSLSTIFDSAINIVTQDYISVNKTWFISVSRSLCDLLIPVITFLLIKNNVGGAMSLVLSNAFIKIALCAFLVFNKLYSKKNG